MSPKRSQKRKPAPAKDYRVQVRIDSGTADILQAHAERRGLGIGHVMRMAAMEYAERVTAGASAPV